MSLGKSTAVTPEYEAIYLAKPKSVQQIVQEMRRFHPRAITHMCAQSVIILNGDKAMIVESQVRIAQGLMRVENNSSLQKQLDELFAETKKYLLKTDS